LKRKQKSERERRRSRDVSFGFLLCFLRWFGLRLTVSRGMLRGYERGRGSKRREEEGREVGGRVSVGREGGRRRGREELEL